MEAMNLHYSFVTRWCSWKRDKVNAEQSWNLYTQYFSLASQRITKLFANKTNKKLFSSSKNDKNKKRGKKDGNEKDFYFVIRTALQRHFATKTRYSFFVFFFLFHGSNVNVFKMYFTFYYYCICKIVFLTPLNVNC